MEPQPFAPVKNNPYGDEVTEISNPVYNNNMPGDQLTHLDTHGNARMVDVSQKPVSVRSAVAKGEVVLKPDTLFKIKQKLLKKGDVLTVAQIAGVMAAKRTAEWIPLCHPIPLEDIQVQVELSITLPGVIITAEVRTTGKTGVEMEALTAVSAAALTIYDMVKAVEKPCIQNIHLVEKHGGTGGDYVEETTHVENEET